MIKVCPKTGLEFEITDEDLAFFKKMDVPAPECHPYYRMGLLMSFRNERSLHRAKCAYSGQEMLSLYPLDTRYKVYEQKVWWSDKWDALDYGRDYDFERSFFDQFEELMLEVPRVNLDNKRSENSDYCNDTDNLQNSYLCFNGGEAQDCYYCTTFGYSRDCMDMFWSMMCELCYECTKVMQGYNCFWCFNCANVSDCYFSEECVGCKNCFGCVGLRQKEYCVYNEQLTKDEYEKFMKDFEFSRENVEDAQLKLAELRLKVPHKNLEITQSEDCLGDYISNSKNCVECFDVIDSESCKHVWDALVDNAYDCFNVGGDEATGKCSFVYCSLATYSSNNVKFSSTCRSSADLIYCSDCDNCDSCFGCVGLRQKKYCILNKQYTKEEYEKILPSIIEHMKKTGEYGSFFPARLSPFGYNDTVANYHFPLKKEVAIAQGFNWSDHQPSDSDVKKVGNAIKCEEDGKLFRIIPQELKFYEKHGIPLPHKCPDCRHFARKRKMNPRNLWDRECNKCGIGLKSTYSPKRSEKIDCEKCYLEEVY